MCRRNVVFVGFRVIRGFRRVWGVVEYVFRG